MANNGEMSELKAKLSWYEREYPLEQKRVVESRNERDELQGKVNALSLQIEELDNRHDTFVRTLANNLGTTQSESEILAKVRSVVEELTNVKKVSQE